MRRMLFLVVALGLFACKTPCANEQVITGGLAHGIAVELQCQNEPQIQQDVVALLARANICTLSEPRGPIAALVCPVVAQAAVTLLGNEVPAGWQCNPALAKEGVAAAITAGCSLLPF